jgi:16S rRNA (cytosine1402-N4)-methyltransferase
MVKDFFGNPIKDLIEINRKVIVATADEIAHNSRARSAKLRVAEKINEN